MRALTERQVRACETAATKRCRCRCGGTFHGASRLRPEDPIERLLELPADDPHAPPGAGQTRALYAW